MKVGLLYPETNVYPDTLTQADRATESSKGSWLWVVAERLIAAILLIAILPVLLVLGLVIKLDSPGPVIFRQIRVGRGGQQYIFYKLRTMYEDNEPMLRAYLNNHPEKHTEWEIYAKLKGYDPRVTRIGRWLRWLSLNEIPQLFNVITGDMSLIGPRPYLTSELPMMGDAAEIILTLRPGITGIWQVSGRNEIPIRQRIEMESWYVQHKCWRLDLSILIKTIPAIFSHKGAY
ncbi:MAG: sugar transferase [Methylocystaceae bacterium]